MSRFVSTPSDGRRRSTDGRQPPRQGFATALRAATIRRRCLVPSLVVGIRRAQPKDSVDALFRWRVPKQLLPAFRTGDLAVGGPVVGGGIDQAVFGTGPEATVPHARECRPGEAPSRYRHGGRR